MPATIDSPSVRTAGAGADGHQQPRLRIRRAPAIDPPFDDDCEGPPAGMDMLPLTGSLFTLAPAAARRPAPGRPEATRPGTARGRTVASEQEGGCSGAAAARRFVRSCVEVINGYRPVAHLRPLTPPQRFVAVTDQLLRRTTRLRMSPAGRFQVRILRIRTCDPTPGAVEAAAVLGHGERCWAMAVRMERGPAGWQCVLVQVV